jgi:transposase
MSRVIIGMDPHKASATIEVINDQERCLATGRFGTDTCAYTTMLSYVRGQWPHRVWAVEGAQGTGRPIAQRLLAGGERVWDVPAKLAARARAFDTGQGRKTDATDAHSIAVVALRTTGLRELAVDEDLVALRLLVDRRDALSRRRTQTVNQLHRLLLELIPGGAPRHLSALQAKTLLASVRPRDLAGRTRRQMAADLVGEVAAVDAKLKDLNGRLRAAVLARGSHLMDLFGVGPAGAARILVDVADVVRFRTRGHFAAWNGTAPLDASSGEQTHHRLSRAGNRRLNHVLHIAAVVQIRHDTDGRAYYRRKLADGKGSLGALRCLRRRISDAVYRQLVADATTAPAPADAPDAPDRQAGPGGHPGATSQSSAADRSPDIGTSDQPQPGPAPATLAAPPAPAKDGASSIAANPSRRAGGVNLERPTGRTRLTPTSAGGHSRPSRTRP